MIFNPAWNLPFPSRNICERVSTPPPHYRKTGRIGDGKEGDGGWSRFEKPNRGLYESRATELFVRVQTASETPWPHTGPRACGSRLPVRDQPLAPRADRNCSFRPCDDGGRPRASCRAHRGVVPRRRRHRPRRGSPDRQPLRRARRRRHRRDRRRRRAIRGREPRHRRERDRALRLGRSGVRQPRHRPHRRHRSRPGRLAPGTGERPRPRGAGLRARPGWGFRRVVPARRPRRRPLPHRHLQPRPRRQPRAAMAVEPRRRTGVGARAGHRRPRPVPGTGNHDRPAGRGSEKLRRGGARVRLGARARRIARRRHGHVAAGRGSDRAGDGDGPDIEPDGPPDEPVRPSQTRVRRRSPGAAVPAGLGRAGARRVRAGDQPLGHGRGSPHRGLRRDGKDLRGADAGDRGPRDRALQLERPRIRQPGCRADGQHGRG